MPQTVVLTVSSSGRPSSASKGAAITAAGGVVIHAASLVDRSNGKADLGVPFTPLIRLDVPSYQPDALPPELEAIPAIKPGSRAPGNIYLADLLATSVTDALALFAENIGGVPPPRDCGPVRGEGTPPAATIGHIFYQVPLARLGGIAAEIERVPALGREIDLRDETRLAEGLGPRFPALGATRGGSPAIFGYTGGHGASIRPSARSRRAPWWASERTAPGSPA